MNTPLTKFGAELLKEELHQLKTKERRIVIDAIADSRTIRTSALQSRVVTYTTIAGAEAAVQGMRHLDELNVYDLQGLHNTLN